MKKIFLILLLTITSVSFCQNKISVKCTADYSCSQKYGISETKRDYTLDVTYNKEKLIFSTTGNLRPNKFNTYFITKATKKYIIGKNIEGNYGFFNINKKQFFNIDYYMNRHITAGYGADSAIIKQEVLSMMKIIKKGNTQKDVIQHLIKQAEYDF